MLTKFVSISMCCEQQRIVANSTLEKTVLTSLRAETILPILRFVLTTSSAELGEKIRKLRISLSVELTEFVNISECCKQQKIVANSLIERPVLITFCAARISPIPIFVSTTTFAPNLAKNPKIAHFARCRNDRVRRYFDVLWAAKSSNK